MCIDKIGFLLKAYEQINNKEVLFVLNDEKTRLSNNVRHIRKFKRLTQKDLAYFCNISIRAVSQIETCSGTPEMFTIAKIAVFAGVDFRQLFGELLTIERR